MLKTLENIEKLGCWDLEELQSQNQVMESFFNHVTQLEKIYDRILTNDENRIFEYSFLKNENSI